VPVIVDSSIPTTLGTGGTEDVIPPRSVSRSVGGGSERAYVVATTVSWLAGATVACVPTVVSQVTLPLVFVQEYQEPPETSCALTVPVVGEIVKATWSTF
jgi:hypothetical protein